VAAVATPAVLLRSHDYGDSSRILRFFTESHGLLSAMAHGVRGKTGKGAASFANFATGDLTVYVKPHRDLHTMKDFVCAKAREGLGSDMLRFSGASAVAELVLGHVEQEPHPGLFSALEDSLDRLSTVPSDQLVAAALGALWSVTHALGFAPQIDACVECGRRLGEDEVGRFDLAAGGVRCAGCAEGRSGPRVGPVARAQVALLVAGGIPEGMTHAHQHLSLVADFIAYHVVSKPLKSLRFLGDLLPEDPVS